MLEFRSELPRGGDSATAFIPWLVAIMVFLGTLAVSGVLTFNSILDGWSRSITGTLTVQLPPPPPDTDQQVYDSQVKNILATLEDSPAVDTVLLLSDEQLAALLSPWLGEDLNNDEIPLPTLIDVTLAQDTPAIIEGIRTDIKAVAPDAVLDDHRRWFEHLIDLTEGFRIIAYWIAVVVSVALALTVVYATRASLAEFSDIISVFHFIGARDMYVASQFAKRTFVAAAKGSVGGLALGALTLMVIGWLARNVESGFLPDISVGLAVWLALPMIAVLAALLAMTTAYLTVLGTLRTML